MERLEALAQGNPASPAYRALLGEAWVASARLAPGPDALERCVDRALSSFRAARGRDPENPRHALMLAEVEREWPRVASKIQEKRRAKDARP